VIRVNSHYGKLAKSYLFVEIARRVTAYQEQHPEIDVIKLGIGDVTRPLSPSVVEAFHRGVDEQAHADSFRGYGPEQGYEFLRTRVAEVDFRSRGCPVSPDEIFISDGAKCDTGNFQELFATDTVIAVPDPVYPVYVDSNVMAGRTGPARDGRYEGLVYLEGTLENGFVPSPPKDPVDLIYLCFPNNPTGACASKEQLADWVEYARANDALILFDAAYEAFIRDETPHSIFEVPGADEVAVEFRSLSKTAGFTGTRLAYTIVPKAIEMGGADGNRYKLWDLWNRRQSTKFNGVSFPVQRAAEAVFSSEGQAEVRRQSDYYLENARSIRNAMESLGYECTGGQNSPYVWVAAHGNSWELFDTFLEQAGVVITPGAGFGTKGEGFVRISGFNDDHKVAEAIKRIKRQLPPTAAAR